MMIMMVITQNMHMHASTVKLQATGWCLSVERWGQEQKAGRVYRHSPLHLSPIRRGSLAWCVLSCLSSSKFWLVSLASLTIVPDPS